MAGHNYISDPKNPFFSLEDDVDDETFIKSAPRRPSAASPNYNPYSSSNNHYTNFDNELEQHHEDLVSRRKVIEERTLQSSERSISLLRDSEQVGAATAEELIRQREQLERTEKRLDDINTTLRFSQKHIQGIKSVFGSLKNYLSGKSIDIPTPSASKIPDVSTSLPLTTSSSLTDSLEQTRNHLTGGEHPSFRLRGLSEEEESYKPVTNHVSAVLEKNLDEMSGSLARLKGLAIGLSEEIDSQNDLLDNITDKTETADITLMKQSKDMRHLLKK